MLGPDLRRKSMGEAAYRFRPGPGFLDQGELEKNQRNAEWRLKLLSDVARTDAITPIIA